MTAFKRAPFDIVTNEIVALSRSGNPENRSWRKVKDAIIAAATCLRLEAHQTTPPIELDDIEKFRHICKKVTFDSKQVLDAVLVPVSGGFLLRLRRGQGEARHRFSRAHEIGHTFFYDLDYDPPSRIFPRDCSRLLVQKEEDICHAFARELLIPGELVQQDIANSSDRYLQMIIDLAAKYVVSPEVAARRLLLDLSKFQSSILLFKDLGVPSGKTVWWFYGSKLKRYLRKEEKAIFGQIVQAIQEGSEPKSIEHIVASNKMVSIEHYQSIPNSRLMTLVTFRRDERSAASPSVSCDAK